MFKKYIEQIERETGRKEIRITSFDLPNYLNYTYLEKGVRKQGTFEGVKYAD